MDDMDFKLFDVIFDGGERKFLIAKDMIDACETQYMGKPVKEIKELTAIVTTKAVHLISKLSKEIKGAKFVL